MKKNTQQDVVRPVNLLCEYTKSPFGIDTKHPRFSWEVKSESRGSTQAEYQIIVASDLEKIDNGVGDIWDSGRVVSNKQTNIVFAGNQLKSHSTYFWSARIWTADKRSSDYSPAEQFYTAFLDRKEWTAEWIRGKQLLRTEFEAQKPLKSAVAYVCGLGYFELRINGQKIGDHVLDPAWTDFDQNMMYVPFDVGQQISNGKNAVTVMLGNGRYSPLDETCAKNWHPLKKYGPSPVLIMELHLTYADGTKDKIVSNTQWKTAAGPILRDDIYDGEIYDSRNEIEGWDLPDFDDAKFEKAIPVAERMGLLESAATFPAIKVIKPRTAVSMTMPAPNTYIFDFGQNFSGWVHLKVKGEKGDRVNMHFAELLNADGTLNPNTNRGAAATDSYILKGEGLEEFEPHFTYHGFRYVEVTGYPGTPSVDDIEARVVHSSVRPVGSFFCSNELINRIHANYRWTQVSNLHSVPTDCCQRDERMGWVGDAQFSAEAAIYNFDMATFYTKFASDIRRSQLDSGSVAGVSPAYWECYPADPTYATAAVEFPWLVSHYYDDERVLEDNYKCMKKWVDFLGSQADMKGIVSFGLFGDWCPPMHANPVDTPFEITSTWYYCHDALMVSKMAERLGHAEDKKYYYGIYEASRDAFNRQYLKGDRYSASKYSDEELAEKIKSWLNVLPPEQRPAIMKRYATLYSASSQTSNLLPLWLGIVPKKNEPEVLATLIQDLKVTHSCHVCTGVVGIKFLFDVLVRYGYEQMAYDLVTQTTFPSWGYQIKEGATTLWERWEYLSDDKCFNSHSHPFHGSIDAWLFKSFGGIVLPEESSGFADLVLRPLIVGTLKYASASVDSIRGRIASQWKLENDTVEYSVEVPGNTNAKVYVPKIKGKKNAKISENGISIFKDGKLVDNTTGISFIEELPGYVGFRVGSGKYCFRSE